MKSPRKSATPASSLELLLDTICNTFGGVLFIAILVVILLQMTNEPRVESGEQVTPERVESLTHELAMVQSELDRLRKNRNVQERLVEQLAPAITQELLRTREQLRESQESLEKRRDQLTAENAKVAARAAAIDADLARTESELERSKSQLDQLKQRLQQAEQDRIEQIRMPIVHSPGVHREIGVILRYERMYVWHKYDPLGNRLGLNTDDFVIVGEEAGGLVTRPNPASGVPLDDSPTSREAIRARLSRFSPDNCYIVAVVRPDSYSAFRFLRDALIDLKFSYRLLPMQDGNPIADRGGSGANVQ